MPKYEIRVLNETGRVLDYVRSAPETALDTAIDAVERKGYSVRVQYRKKVRRGAKPQMWVTV